MLGWKHKLIWNWKSAWKWASVQFIALGAAVQLALLAFPADLRTYLPDWATHSVVLFCFGAAAYGRVTTRNPEMMVTPPLVESNRVTWPAPEKPNA